MRIFQLVRKYAAPAALAAVLLGLIAAPYLVPENPDSRIFRSGALALILMLACFFPVRQAYQQASRRTLTACLALGLLFACALGLGSELYVYDGLLPGAGSMLRRLAVPFLAAPLFGGLAARLMLAAPASSGGARIPFAAYMLVILLAWSPLLLAYYPGMLNYDFKAEYMQHISGEYSSLHPLLHSALMNGTITLGEKIAGRTFGVLLMSVLQALLFAASLAHACVFAQRRGAPRSVLFALTALFAVHPVFSVMAFSMTKDTLFAAAVLTLSLESFELITSPDAYLNSRRRCALFILLSVGAALMRSNGVFALALLFPALIIAVRGFRRKAAALCAAGGAASLFVLGVLTLVLSPSSMPSFQLYSLPAQQLVRAYGSGKLYPEEQEEIASWYVSEDGLVVHPHLADPAKGYLDKDRLEREGGAFLALHKRHADVCAHEYAEALLMLNVGSWYPDDLSHSTIYPDVSWNEKGYLQTQEYDMTEQGIHTRSLLPRVTALYERICRYNSYQKHPVVSLLFAAATPLWVLLFACALLISRRQARFLPAALGCMGLWISYLFGPCTLARYMLPLFCLAPVLLIAAFYLPDNKQ